MTADAADALGGRLPLADPATLTGEQRALFDRMMAHIVPWADEAGFESTAADGRLIGPFNPALLNPAVTASMLDLSAAEGTHTSLSDRVREVVILAVGRSGRPTTRCTPTWRWPAPPGYPSRPRG